MNKLVDIITDLYPWQKDIVDMVQTKSNDYVINWYCNTEDISRIELIKLLCYKYDALMVTRKVNDMKRMIVNCNKRNGYYPNLIIFDVSRLIPKYIDYGGIEEIKNGIFNTVHPYNTVLMDIPHVLIFANTTPDLKKISVAKYKITHL